MTVTKVLIDGGAGLNIIFSETLRKIGLDFTGLITPTGILGQITLPVMFGTQANYQTEFI
jgi:hypothetical protein